MSSPGEPDLAPDDLLVRSRSVMLDALEALAAHRDAVIVIGAQAVYLRTGGAQVALAEATKDSDLAMDPRRLGDDPRVEAAMSGAGFIPNPVSRQPGAWINPQGIPVDLMVPEALAGEAKRGARGVRLPPHGNSAMRRAHGLEAALVDNSLERVRSLDAKDDRSFEVRVAGPAALLVAKTIKITERITTPHRLNDKDAHDMYRVLVAIDTFALAEGISTLLTDPISRACTAQALDRIGEHIAAGPAALISMMAGRAEAGIGEPDTVSLAASTLASDLIDELRRQGF
ncbi:MAG: GSU2403 family nucleotidyltransferase fold protein [Lapillicoccus sp.]